MSEDEKETIHAVSKVIEKPTSDIESPWSQELAEYMYEKYGIDIDKIMYEAILETEDAEKVRRIMEQTAKQNA